MARRIRPNELSESDLKRLLLEKRLEQRERRLDEYRRSRRVVSLVAEPGAPSLEDFGTDELENVLEESQKSAQQSRRKQTIDRTLLAVEVLAVLGLAFILLNGASVLQELNEQVSAALLQPSLTPTPLVRAVVLPSGHTPPTAPGGARPNDAEIPEHLRPLLQTLASIPIPTPSPEQAVRLQIPAIGVDHPIVQGDGWEDLKKGVGQHIGTANPGQDGNLVLSAHNDVFGEIFRHLDKLQAGDEIIVFTNQRAYTYVIGAEFQVVEPTAVQVMDPTADPTLTLISCYPYLVNSQRIVVTASLIDG
jgi:sortase A